MNLDAYRLPLAPAPARIQALLQKGVINHHFPEPADVISILRNKTAPTEGVWRADDGTALLVCNTDFTAATPAMLDWWFGWHLTSSERYRLWHPTAHLQARVKEDRSHLPDHRAHYIGNESYVDEYIGKKIMRLAIRFVPPQQFGFTDLDAEGSTAICGITRDRLLQADGGYLCHLVVPTENGCQMRSGFWLGKIRHRFSLIHLLAGKIYNARIARRHFVSDQFCLDLLQHCSEEMSHLAKFLPRLFADQQGQ